jgi:hypothetical protein
MRTACELPFLKSLVLAMANLFMDVHVHLNPGGNECKYKYSGDLGRELQLRLVPPAHQLSRLVFDSTKPIIM